MAVPARYLVVSLLALLCASTAARAASPALSSILPRGGQRGTEVEVTFAGDRLADAEEILIYHNAGGDIAVVEVNAVDAKRVKAKLKIAPTARLGEYPARVRTKSGLSELRTFWVGPYPTTREVEPNNEFDKPQKIEAANVTVSGVITNEDVDHFVVTARKGQRITAEVEGFRLGNGFFDPYVAILDKDRFEIAASDDSALLLQDPVASVVAPDDGQYVVQLRESSYGGADGFHYRLHVGDFPRPLAASPAGAQVGQQLDVRLVGDVAGPTTRPVKAAEAPGEMPIVAEQNGVLAPSPVPFRVSPFPGVAEAEPNGEIKTGTPAGGELPRAFNGVIGKPGDVDFFRFTAKKDQVFDINVYARRLRSPLDPMLNFFSVADGKHIDGNDDNGSPDSYQRVTIPADGEYAIRVRDHLNNGGPEYVYRVEITPVQPKVTLSIPLVANNSQERQVIAVPRGNRFATMVRVARADFGGDLTIAAPDLPQGVTIHADTVGGAPDAVPVVFEAAADAPVAGKLCDLVAQPVDANAKVASEFNQAADLVVGMNNTAFYQAKVDKLAVAVVEEVPFTLQVVQPKVPIVQNGAMQLKVVATRKEGFNAPIRLMLPFNPPGVSSGQVTIPESQTEAVIPLNASGEAAAKKWKVCVLGAADANGTMWVSSPLADLEVAAPFVAAKIEMASTEQGKPAQVLATLEQRTPFDGKAKIQLVGLPPNAATGEKEIAATDAQVTFDVTTTDKTPAGQHKSLFCVVTVMKDGEPVVHNIGHGGVLRVDAPKPAPAAPVAAAATPKPPEKKPEKPLSRLEQLRLEAKQRSGS